MALRIFTHFTDHLCPVDLHQSFTVPSSTPVNDAWMLCECHLTFLSSRWPLVHPGQPSLFQILLLLNMNASHPHLSLFSSVPLSNFHSHHPAPLLLSTILSSCFSLYSHSEEEEENGPLNRQTTSGRVAIETVRTGEKGLMCLWNAVWECVDLEKYIREVHGVERTSTSQMNRRAKQPLKSFKGDLITERKPTMRCEDEFKRK